MKRSANPKKFLTPEESQRLAAAIEEAENQTSGEIKVVLARHCWTDIRAKASHLFKKFNLELHPDKTRLMEFGRFAADRRKRRGDGKPETFDFLGFTHICGKSRKGGRFTIRRHTMRKRLHRKVREVHEELYRRRHEPTAGCPYLKSNVFIRRNGCASDPR